MTAIKTAIITLLISGSAAFANMSHSNHATMHAPIGVMGDHIHQKDEFMWSFRTMMMRMDDTFLGSRKANTDMGHMDMTMHMLGAMWGVTDTITLMAMLPYSNHSMTMTMTNGMGMSMTNTTTNSGFNDIKLSSIIGIQQTDHVQWLINAGFTVPVGTITKKNSMGALMSPQHQLGSGTIDLELGTTLTNQLTNELSFGGQVLGLIRTGQNSNNITLGNRYTASAWGQYQWNTTWSTSLRSSTTFVSNSSSTTDASIQSMIGIGAMMTGSEGWLTNSRLAIEWLVPVFRWTAANQLTTNSTVTLGFQQMI